MQHEYTKVALCPIAGFKDAPEDTVLAGAWFTGTGDAGMYTIHPYPLEAREAWEAACQLADHTYEKVMGCVSQFLDRVHREQLGRRYWDQCVGWFVRMHVEVVTERQIVLESLAAAHPGAVFIGLHPDNYRRPADARDFVSAIRKSDLANLQVMSQVAHAMELRVDERRAEATDPRSFGATQARTRAPLTVRFLNHLMSWGHRGRICLYKTLIRRRALAKLIVATGFSAWPLEDLNVVTTASPDERIRRELAEMAAGDSALRIHLIVLAQNFPVCLLEGWPELARATRTMTRRSTPDAIVTGLGHFWDAAFAVWAAECQRTGTRTIGLQHGGAYGELQWSSFERHERRIADEYITWGWREDARTVPLPAARLADIPQSGHAGRKGILWVGTSDARYTYQLGPRPHGPLFLRYFEDQVCFGRTLTAAIARQVLYRPYPDDLGWGDAVVSRLPPEIQVDRHEESFWARANAASLVVVDHVGSTTFLEVLALNRPAICFGRPELFQIRQSARPWYDALERVGVFFQSPEEAARAVLAIAYDPAAWWAEPERQQAVAAFRKNFCMADAFQVQWTQFLRRLARDTSVEHMISRGQK